MIRDDYFSFLSYRAAQRRLAAKFAHPRNLTLHTLAFIVAITALLAYGVAADWWYDRNNLVFPTSFGFLWSLALLLHAVWHYRHSAASALRREVVVEEEMRQMIASSAEPLDDQRLFDLHRLFETGLEREGSWSTILLVFAAINALSWGLSLLNAGTSWPFQMTQPIAVVILGGGAVVAAWHRYRHASEDTWFTRIPVRHIIAFVIGAPILMLLGAYHAINYWDAQILIGWWMIAVLAHIVLAEAVLPLIRRFMPKQAAKRKRDSRQRLMLGDDGEITEVVESDGRQAQASP